MFDTYNVKLRLLNDMLGTNPIDLNVMDKHILDRQRKLIAENSKINKAVNKYLEAKDISIEQGEVELSALKGKIEEIIGREVTDEEFAGLKQGDLKKIATLKETIEELDQKGITCFLREPNTGKICIGSHMIIGFLKAAGEAISRTMTAKKETMLASSSYTSKIINQHLSVKPALIVASEDIKRTFDGTPDYLQRSLRAMTAQGPRISLAKSEVLPAGTVFEFDVLVMENSPMKEEILSALFEYGKMKGLGQWRNSDYGQFEVIAFDRALRCSTAQYGMGIAMPGNAMAK